MRNRGLSGGVVGLSLLLILAAFVPPAKALDTDIFTGPQVDPNVLILFDNSGSMGYVAYNVYPTTIYTGSYDPATIYTRCRTKNGVSGGAVWADCTCRRTQSDYIVDESSCAASVVDLVPGPGGDDIDDRESRRRRGNRRNFETNPPKLCVLPPIDACNSDADCPGLGNSCAVQNKMSIAKAVMTSLVNDPNNQGVRFGLTLFNPPDINYSTLDYFSTSDVGAWQINDQAYAFPVQDMDAAARASLTSTIQGLNSAGGTPTTHRLIDAWKYFNGEAQAPGFGTSPVEATCQRNYLIMITDGIPEVEADRYQSTPANCEFTRLQSFMGVPGDLNGDGKEDPASPNYLATTGEMFNCGSDYLDDAMFKIRGEYPLGNTENQPLSLFAISFGFDYCQKPGELETGPGAGSLLWRAADKYGGGECLSASDPQDLDDALREVINLIKNDAQSFVAPVVPVSQTNRTESGDRLYVALFSPREGQIGWPGNIKKYALDKNAGAICNASTPNCSIGGGGSATLPDGTILATAESFWDAGSGGPSGNAVTSGGIGGLLQESDFNTRKLYTYTGTATGALGGLDLTLAPQAFAKGNAAITPAMLGLSGVAETAAERDLLIDYLYGFDSYDLDNDGDLEEKRPWILGDIIHSVPLVVRYDSGGADALILVGANDGMLHAFDDATGQELWAFIPPDVLSNLNNLRPGETATHAFFVDGSARVTEYEGQKIVVFGLGRGGRAYYALDITSKAAPRLLWRVNDSTAGYAELGYAQSTPALTKFSPAGGVPVAVVGGGYDVYFDDPAASTPNPSGYGRALFVIDLLTGARRAIASPTGMDYAIASDPLVFDVNGDGMFDRGYIGDLGGNIWRIQDDFSVTKLFQAPAGRRIFYPPDAVLNSGSVMIYFGTGDRSNPLETSVTDRFYAVRDDGASNLGEAALVDVTNNIEQPGTAAEAALLQQIAAQHGWYLRLQAPGEKVLAPPTVFFNAAFATFTPSVLACSAGGDAKIYVLNPLNGAPTLDLAGTSGGNLGDGSGVGSGSGGVLVPEDRWVLVGQSIPTSLKVTFGDDETKAFFGVTKGGGIGLQPLSLPQIAANVIPVSWRQVW
ncbi:MAG: PilC/PilY family type IV pilus protein [Deltaproteobacteria bacterium]